MKGNISPFQVQFDDTIINNQLSFIGYDIEDSCFWTLILAPFRSEFNIRCLSRLQIWLLSGYGRYFDIGFGEAEVITKWWCGRVILCNGSGSRNQLDGLLLRIPVGLLLDVLR